MAYQTLISVAFVLVYLTLALLVMAGSSLIGHRISQQRALKSIKRLYLAQEHGS
jgi:hypothetical protein